MDWLTDQLTAKWMDWLTDWLTSTDWLTGTDRQTDGLMNDYDWINMDIKGAYEKSCGTCD